MLSFQEKQGFVGKTQGECVQSLKKRVSDKMEINRFILASHM